MTLNLRAAFPLMLLMLLPVAQTRAGQAYTWVDEAGTTHFSETPPYDETVRAEVINLLPAPSAGNRGDDDFYSVANQAARMERKRLENEKLIAQRRLAEAEAKKAVTETQANGQSKNRQTTRGTTGYYPAYPYYPRNRHQPGHGNKPYPGNPDQPRHPRKQRPVTSLDWKTR